MNVNGCCFFFHMEELRVTPLLHLHFHVGQIAPLLPSVTWQQNVTEYWWEGSASTAMPKTSAFAIVGQNNKIGCITFGAALELVQVSSLYLYI